MNMKQIFFYIRGLFDQIIVLKLIVLTCLIALASSCTKSSSPSTGPANSSGTLLTKEVIIGKNHLNVTVDSIVYTYTYGANQNVSQIVQTMSSVDSIFTSTTSLTYDFIYSGNVLSTINGSFTQSVSGINLSNSATTIISTSFTSSGGKLTGYVQTTSTSGTPYLPVTSTTGNDSAIFTYDASGNLATYNVYQSLLGIPGYLPYSKETFSFNNGTLIQTINNLYVAGILEDTVTTNYTYNSSVAASPLYIAFGVPIAVPNDIAQINFTTTGVNPNMVASSYSSTYNAANQPTSSVVTLTETPSFSGDLMTENITYTYQ